MVNLDLSEMSWVFLQRLSIQNLDSIPFSVDITDKLFHFEPAFTKGMTFPVL